MKEGCRRNASPSGARRRPPRRRGRGCAPAAKSARCPATPRRVPWLRRIPATSLRPGCARRSWRRAPTGPRGSGSSRRATGLRIAPNASRRGDVYLGTREIGDAADVVAVEMGDDDVAHVVTAKAKLLDLIDGGFRRVEHRADQVPRRSHPPGGIVAVLRPEAGVDQYQTVVGLDEQHVAHHLAAPERVQGSAVEVMNLHTCSLHGRWLVTRESRRSRCSWCRRCRSMVAR